MDAIDAISDEAWRLMKSEKYDGNDAKVSELVMSLHETEQRFTLQELVTMNQHLLNTLGAGHESIDKVLAIAKSHGHPGKLTGAGGGGCVIVHLPEGKNVNPLIRCL